MLAAHTGVNDRCNPDALLALMQAGDLRALDAVVHCYSARLVAVGRRCCRRPEDAEDAIQQALLDASRSLADYRGEGSPLAWLSTMVARRCRKQQRGQRNDLDRHVPIETAACTCAAPSPEEMAARAELTDRLEIALAEVRRSDRLLLILSLEGWSSPELAEHFGTTPEAIRTRLSRLRRRLRHTLKENE